MVETATAATEQAQQQEQAAEAQQQKAPTPKLSGYSAPVAVSSSGDNAPQAAAAPKPSPEPTAAPSGGEAAPKPSAGMSDEQLAEALKARGLEFDGNFENLKTKLSSGSATTAAEPTETSDQKAARELALEKRVLDLFTAKGGKIEDYVAIKQAATADLKQLSEAEIRAEYKSAGFSEEEINAILKQRYYQLDDEELEQFDDESEKEFAKRKKEFFSKKLEQKASYTQKEAARILSDLSKAIEQQDSEKREKEESEKLYLSTVDETLKALPRELEFDLGQIDGVSVAPVKMQVSPDDIAEIKNVFTDQQKRETQFLTKEGYPNVQTLASIMAENRVLKQALKVAYSDGKTSQVNIVQKIFPSQDPHSVGVGGGSTAKSAAGTPGKLVGAGAPEVVNQQRKKSWQQA